MKKSNKTSLLSKRVKVQKRFETDDDKKNFKITIKMLFKIFLFF